MTFHCEGNSVCCLHSRLITVTVLRTDTVQVCKYRLIQKLFLWVCILGHACILSSILNYHSMNITLKIEKLLSYQMKIYIEKTLYLYITKVSFVKH